MHVARYNLWPVHVPRARSNTLRDYIRKATYNPPHVIRHVIEEMCQAQPILSAMQTMQQRSFDTNAVVQ